MTRQQLQYWILRSTFRRVCKKLDCTSWAILVSKWKYDMAKSMHILKSFTEVLGFAQEVTLNNGLMIWRADLEPRPEWVWPEENETCF
jgi:hypothetical protein